MPVPQHLQLLPDFVFDMPVARMQFLQFPRKRVNVLVAEFGFAQAPDQVQDVQRPAAFGHGQFLQRFDLLEPGADFDDGRDGTVANEVNPGVNGNAVEGKIAADPTGAAGGGRQRFAV